MERKCCNCGAIHNGYGDFCSDKCADEFSEYINDDSDEQNSGRCHVVNESSLERKPHNFKNLIANKLIHVAGKIGTFRNTPAFNLF